MPSAIVASGLGFDGPASDQGAFIALLEALAVHVSSEDESRATLRDPLRLVIITIGLDVPPVLHVLVRESMPGWILGRRANDLIWPDACLCGHGSDLCPERQPFLLKVMLAHIPDGVARLPDLHTEAMPLDAPFGGAGLRGQFSDSATGIFRNVADWPM